MALLLKLVKSFVNKDFSFIAKEINLWFYYIETILLVISKKYGHLPL